MATAAGFVHEGTLRQSYRYPDGRYHDEHLHGILASDLTGARGSFTEGGRGPTGRRPDLPPPRYLT
mgnify:FL=1